MQAVAHTLSAVAPLIVQSQTLGSPTLSNKHHQITKPFIDKLSLTIAIDCTEHRGALVETIMDETQDGIKLFFERGWQSVKLPAYKHGIRLHSPNDVDNINGPFSKETFAIFQCGPKKSNAAFVRLEWNPARWTPERRDYLIEQLGFLLTLNGTADVTLPSLLAGARVSRVDVALDVPGIRPDRFLWDQPKGRYRNVIVHNGRPETLYLGSRLGNKANFAIYDKSEQAKLATDVTRVEWRGANPNVLAQGLTAMPNPFANLACYDALQGLVAGNIGPTMLRPNIADAAQLRGLKGALASIPDVTLRTNAEKAITACIPMFWNPASTWQHWPDAVANALPFLFPVTVLQAA